MSNTNIDPQHTALLVMDYQVGIVSSMPDAAGLLNRVVSAIATARSHGIQIGYVRVAFKDEDYEKVPTTNKSFAALADSHRLDDTAPETQIHEAVAPQDGDIIVRKVRVGAFSTTDLSKQLQAKKIDTLILAGLSTSGVLLSTVRDAADHDYRLLVLEDASADRDEEVHATLMQKVFPRQATVISTDDLLNLLQTS